MSRKVEKRPRHLTEDEKDQTQGKAIGEKQKSEKRKRRIPLGVWIVAAVLVLLLLGGSYLTFSYFYSRLNISAGDEKRLAVDDSWKNLLSDVLLGDIDRTLQNNLESEAGWDYNAADVTNILLIGVDNDYAPGMDDRGNADGLIIVSINKTTKQVVLSSLMRDIYVSVPDKYNTKITLAYHYEGTQVLIDTIEANFGIPIDNYVLVNYLNVIDIVDAVGGLTIDVDSDELYWMESKIRNLNQLLGLAGDANLIDPSEAGTPLLNGVQTAAYMRIRYAGDGDFDRTARAREVLLGLRDKAADMKATELINFADMVLPMITTDISQMRALSLVMSAPSYLGYEMVSNRIPIDGSWYFADLNGSVVVVDFSVNREFLYQSIYEGKTS